MGGVVLCLTGDVMTGRGVDQILPAAGDPRLWERYVDNARTYVQLIDPAEVLLRNFYFCAVEDPSSFALRDVIGVDHIFLEQDYPHCDSTWPHTLETAKKLMGHLPAETIHKIVRGNAIRMLSLDLPS